MGRAEGQGSGRHLTRAGLIYTSWALFSISSGFRGWEVPPRAALMTGSQAAALRSLAKPSPAALPQQDTVARGGGHGGTASGLSQMLVPNPLQISSLKNPRESSVGCGECGGGEAPLSELEDGGHSLAMSWAAFVWKGSSSGLEAVTPPA